MSNSVIRAELDGRLKAWASAQTPKVPVAFEGLAFTKPTDGVFLESFLLPAATFNTDITASKERRIGVYQVNCWAKNTGRGMKVVEQLAQNVANLFPVVPKTGVVSIEQPPHVEDSILDPSGWIIVPVVIRYRHES